MIKTNSVSRWMCKGKMQVGLFLVMVALATMGCHSATRVRRTLLKKSYTASEVLQQMGRHQLRAEWLSAKARIDWVGPEGSQQVSAIVRGRRDSVLMWVFRKYNIEVARLLLRPDSVFLIDRLNKQYLAADFAWVRRRLGLPFGFREWQMLLWGNPVFLGKTFHVRPDSTMYVLESKGQRFEGSWWCAPSTWRLHKMRLYDPMRDEELIYRLERWQPMADGMLFSYFRNLEVFTPTTGFWQVTVAFSKVEVDKPKTIKFDIPKHYTQVE